MMTTPNDPSWMTGLQTQHDSYMALKTAVTVPSASTVGIFYVDPVSGNDSHDGRSWQSAVATISAALTLCTANAAVGEIRLGRGVHNVTATLVIPQAVKLRGFGSLVSQETEIVWTGADDGSYVIRTAGDTSGNDFTRGELSGFLLRPAASKPGGGAYTNLNGLYARNMQNGAIISNIRVQNFPGTGIMGDRSNGGVPAAGFPGYCAFDRVWSTGNNVNWHMYGGFTSVLFLMCAGDVSSNTTDVFIIDGPTSGTNGGRGGNYLFIGFKSEDNGTPTGAGADPNYFVVNTDISLGFDGCSAKRGSPGTKAWINYTATPASQNAIAGTVPVTIRNSHTSNLPVAVTGPTGNLLVPTVGTGGQSFQISQWSQHATTHIRGGSDPISASALGAVPARVATSALMAETVPRTGNTTQAASAGVVYLARITLQPGAYTTVTCCPTAGGTGLSNAFFGLYDVTSLALLATSSSAVTALQTTVGAGQAPPTTSMSYTVTAAGDFYLAMLIGAGTTMPTLVAGNIQAAALQSLLAPFTCHRHNTTGLTALPATVTLMSSPSAMLLPWMRYE